MLDIFKRKVNRTRSKSRIKVKNIELYRACIEDLISHESVKSMSNFIQHNNITCLDHCISVSYCSYVVCRFLRLDWYSAARGGLLHDLFLYDWHCSSPENGLHAFVHPSIALKNAEIFNLSEMERDIIKKHMWPLTVVPPRYIESFIVSCIDKYCAVLETLKSRKKCA